MANDGRFGEAVVHYVSELLEVHTPEERSARKCPEGPQRSHLTGAWLEGDKVGTAMKDMCEGAYMCAPGAFGHVGDVQQQEDGYGVPRHCAEKANCSTLDVGDVADRGHDGSDGESRVSAEVISRGLGLVEGAALKAR